MSEHFALPSSIAGQGALALCAACALVCGAAAQDRGRLIGLEAGGDVGAASIDVIGDRPLSFTTLRLHAPPRVVVDFADAELSGIPRELAVDDGTIRRVAAAAAGQRTARVVIELAGEAEFDVRAQGNRVQVRVPRIAPLVATAETKRADEAPGGAAGGPPAGAAGEPPTGAAGEPQAHAAAGPPAAAAAPQAGAAGPQTGARGPATVPEAPGSVRSTADDAAARKREQRIAAYTPAQRAAAERAAAAQRAARERRLAAQEKAAASKRAAAEKAAAVKNARALAAAEQAARAKQSRAAAIAQKEVARRTAAEQAARAEQARALALADKAAAGRRASVPPQRTVAPASPLHAITGIGFRPIGAGEVIVRSDGPLEYGVSADGDALLLHLPGATIRVANNRRPLDTHFFNGPVQRVVPLAVADGTDLRIEVRGHAEYQVAQSGGVLTVTFSAPR